jgi:hypothetical protein
MRTCPSEPKAKNPYTAYLSDIRLLSSATRVSNQPFTSLCYLRPGMRVFALLAVLIAPIALTAQQASPSIDVPPGAHLLLEAKGEGVQIYTCTDSKWTLKAPDAKLLDAQGQVIGTHFAGPTWKLNDGSEVKGKAIANQPSPEAGSVPWLLLQAVPGSGSGKFADVTYIRRTETHSGAAPKEDCTSGESRQSYTATYSFYTK